MTDPPPPAPSAAPPPPPPRGFWRRRLIDPLKVQLSLGVSPDKLAATLAAGTVCALFPFLGFTILLCLGLGLSFRMNHPILQTLNQLLGPLQIVLIPLYVRLGEWIWRADYGERFNVRAMVNAFRDASIGEFLEQFGRAGLHAFTAWLVTAPLLLALLYYTLRPLLRRLRSPGPTPPTL